VRSAVLCPILRRSWQQPPRNSAQPRAKALDAAAGLFEVLGRGGVGNAKGRPEPKGRAVYYRDAFGGEELRDEILVDRNLLPRRRGLADRALAERKDVEGALGLRASDAFRLVEHRDDEIAAFLERLVVLRDEVLRPLERLDPGPLRDRRRVGGRLRLQRAHRLDELLRSGGVAEPPAGHAIGLRHAVQGQRPLIKL